MRREDYDVFYDKFRPEMQNETHNSILWETYGEDLDYVRTKNSYNIWTVIDGSSGKLYICPGYHIVNRLNYIITLIPWKEGQRDYLYSN